MARMPGQPVDEQGRPIHPSATGDEDDVQGHVAFGKPIDEPADAEAERRREGPLPQVPGSAP